MLGAGLLMATGGAGYDSDAQTYITAVETADGQSLETAVKDAINAFVVGCKNDGIWSAIKASCILVGARTLSGALVPLVGTAPTNNGFLSSDYNRKTGVTSPNSGTKNINTNRNNNVDPQNDQHLSMYASAISNKTGTYIFGAGAGATGTSSFYCSSTNNPGFRCRSSTGSVAGGSMPPGFYGMSRSISSNFIYSISNTETTANVTSQTPFNGTIATVAAYPATFAFYSIGTSLDLTLLRSRVITLTNAIAAAIP